MLIPVRADAHPPIDDARTARRSVAKPWAVSGVLALGLVLAACVELPGPLPPFPGAADGTTPDTAPDPVDMGPDPMDGPAPDAAPAPVELCNGLDDDGDGRTDEIAPFPAPESRMGDDPSRCRPLIARCVDGVSVTGPDRFEDDETACDGLDNDCDGRIDEAHGNPCVWCDGTQPAPPCNGCPDRTVIPPSFGCIPPGRFTMGSSAEDPDRESDEGPLHPVEFERPYLIGLVELTQGRWQALLGDAAPENPAWFSDDGGGGVCDEGESGRCPIERISWFDALWFANLISDAQGLEACYVLDGCEGRPFTGCGARDAACSGDFACDDIAQVADCTGYRLPSEAEWERAARGGNNNRYWSGDTTADLGRVDVFRSNSGQRPRPYTANEARNGYGLRDVHGNVAEWVFDGYAPYPEPPISRIDPVVEGGARRVVRGGSWDATFAECRSAARDAVDPVMVSATRGARLARHLRPAPYEVPPSDDAPGGEMIGPAPGE